MRSIQLFLFFLTLCLLPSCRAAEPQSTLVNLESLHAGFVLDIRYATVDNFTKEILYPFPRAFLQRQPAEALVEVQKELQQKGLGLKIFDAYRPLSIQVKMWNLIHDERYVSDPSKNAGRHTRGTAVDVTLVTADGRDLAMPSAFDDFSEKSHSDFTGATAEQTKNRAILREAMEKHGFTVLPTEWWHFDFKDWKTYPPMDIPFDKLRLKTPY